MKALPAVSSSIEYVELVRKLLTISIHSRNSGSWSQYKLLRSYLRTWANLLQYALCMYSLYSIPHIFAGDLLRACFETLYSPSTISGVWSRQTALEAKSLDSVIWLLGFESKLCKFLEGYLNSRTCFLIYKWEMIIVLDSWGLWEAQMRS